MLEKENNKLKSEIIKLKKPQFVSSEDLAKENSDRSIDIKWYLAEKNTSCLDYCKARGGYNIATENNVGHKGTYKECVKVAIKFGADTVTNTVGKPWGCYKSESGHFYYSRSLVNGVNYQTRPDFKNPSVMRICACNS